MASPVLHENIRKYAKLEFEKRAANASGSQDQDFETFLKQLDSPESSAARPIKVDTSHPISHYFVSSSHNTYLSGNQLWSKSSTDSYKDVLKRGCRCIEIDIWDGGSPSSSEAEDGDKMNQDGDATKLTGLLKKKLGRLRSRSNPDKEAATTDSPASNQTLMPTPWRSGSGRAEPLVYHGYTVTTEIPFRKVCEVVREYAFRTSDLPLIASLEVHCHPSQQKIVVELINDYWGQFLERVPDEFSDTTPLPTLESLKRKILVKVKFTPPEKAKKAAKAEQSSKPDDGPDSNSDDDPNDAVKKGKIIDGLSNMGIFTRAFHFHSFDQPEANIPTHVFSLGESKLIGACEEQPDKLLKHNLHHLMRAYPKGSRLRSSNLDPALFWRFGLQMVALNFQKLNAAMMLNTAQFEGSGGWVLKPQGYLPTGKGIPSPERKTLSLDIKIFAAQGLGRDDDVPNVYVKCELHVESSAELNKGQIPNQGKNKGGEWKRSTATKKSRNPDWSGEALTFDGVPRVVPELSFVRFKVMDDASYQKDKLIGWACYRLDRLAQGLILVHLRGEDSKPTGGKLLMNIRSTLSG